LAGVGIGTERIQRYEIYYYHQSHQILFAKVRRDAFLIGMHSNTKERVKLLKTYSSHL
jgi:hypothetical protein